MLFYKINNQNAQKLFQDIGCQNIGSKIMANKTKMNLIYIHNMHVGAANILKQDALSIGADLAVPDSVILAKDKYVNAILIGSNKHLKILSKKELSQPFGLKKFAIRLSKHINYKKHTNRIMGIINANDDSFFNQSRFKKKKANKKILSMIKEGANIIDIGGVSSRPGSKMVSSKEELKRVKPIIEYINKNKLYKKILFSIDSYSPKVVKFALKNNFKIVNDITGLKSDKIAKLTAKYNATIVIMHMKGSPQNMQFRPQYDNIMHEIDIFFQERIEKAKKFGINNIILDIGIGFGKTLEHNILLIKNLEHFKHFGYELLVGASRKSLINDIIPANIKNRLPGTISIHLNSLLNGASIIRCHDVAEHVQAIKVQEKIIDN